MKTYQYKGINCTNGSSKGRNDKKILRYTEKNKMAIVNPNNTEHS